MYAKRGYDIESLWRALPIDGSENEWASEWKKEFGCTRQIISGALKALCDEKKEETLYYQVKQKFPEDKKEKSKGQKIPNDTHPGRFYWEIKPLIHALAYVRKQNRKLKTNDLAEQTFQKLASDLLDEDLTEKTFSQIQLINNQHIRTQMLQKFQNEITIRLDAVKFLTSHRLGTIEAVKMDPDAALVKRIQIACQAMDTLIATLLEPFQNAHLSEDILSGWSMNEEQSSDSSVTADDVYDLYKTLVTQREKITKYESTADEYVIHTCLDPNVDKEIREKLINAVSTRKRKKSRIPISEDRRHIELAYERYLLATIPAAEKKQAEELLTAVANLKRFMWMHRPFQYYETQIRKEFYKEVHSIFLDLDNLDRIDYAYSPGQVESLEVMYVIDSIRNENQKMRYNIHWAVTFLLQRLTLDKFLQDDLHQYNTKKLLDDMRIEYQKLAKENSSLPLGSTVKDIPIDRFVSEYNEKVCPVLGTSHLEKQDMELWHSCLEGQDTWAQDATTNILRCACELVTVNYVHATAIPDIRHQHNLLSLFYLKLKNNA